ncbi:hypothetical protein DL96DRAFT_1603605 [Flagelloscypha sp. PMI_526]|nr:hypothetical protein DL96DRAFT_1603605 [Flagelloscypha sp. PMI_526]
MRSEWSPGIQYSTGSTVTYQGSTYTVVQPHLSQADWTPALVPALFTLQSGQHGSHPKASEHAPASSSSHVHPPDTSAAVSRVAQSAPTQMPVPSPYHAADTSQTQTLPAPPTSWPSTKDEWIAHARDRTSFFHANGPRNPATWILVDEHLDPSATLSVGEFFVARGFFEGNIIIGEVHKSKTSHANFADSHATEFEILVGDPHGIRWVDVNGKFDLNTLPYRPIEAGKTAGDALLYVAQGYVSEAQRPGMVADGGEAIISGHHTTQYQVLCYV